MTRCELFWRVLAVSIVMMGASLITPVNAADIQLSQQCPASFEQREGRCYLQTIYRQYQSLQNKGVGGLKTALPTMREGFTPQQIDLGRYLFFDPLLSGDGKQSCASCHDPQLGFSDGRARSVGHNGHEVKRAAPTLWNVAFLQKFFWDGRADTLEAQMQGPLYAAEEMANTPQHLAQSINQSPTYRRLFKETFGGDTIALESLYTALAAFESSLISLNSRYDWYAHGVSDALDAREIAGLNVFRSFVARCAECHTPPLFTNQQIAVLGVPEGKGVAFDVGNEAISGEKTLRGGFKIPSLRNIALTAPYTHSGAFDNLPEMVKFYTQGRGHAVPKNEQLLLHWHIWEPKLTDTEIDQVVAFLHTLTDTSFMPSIPVAVPSGLAVTLAIPPQPIASTTEKKQ